MKVQLENVNKVYDGGAVPVTAVADVSLTVQPGEMVAITGRSGSGKTTLLNLIGGIEQPTSGEVILDGNKLGAMGARRLARFRRRSLGYVFQDLNLIPVLTAIENVALPLELDGHSRSEAEAQARAALAEVVPVATFDRHPDQLSGGEQQRVAIARALCASRRLLLADEPTGALDDLTAEAIMGLLLERARAGATVIVVTHDPVQAGWADRVVHLADQAIHSTSTRGGGRRG